MLMVKINRVKKNQSSIMFGTVKRAEDTEIATQQPFEVEDEFMSLYQSGATGQILIAPPFNPQTLVMLCTRNNILQQAVHVMEVNIDGTGHSFDLKTDAKEDKAEKKRAEDFFEEPYPKQSFISIRRKVRVDMEQAGYGYLEIIRNVKGEMVFVRHVKAHMVRIVRLDTAVEVEKEITRDGKKMTAKMLVRERRFCQMIGTAQVFFKEYGASRNVHRQTGEWITKDGKDKTGRKVEPAMIGGELLRFGVDDDATTPYHIPRWINNLPSVLGSRKAEEFNLDFFDAGGMPPAIIFIQGGALTTTVREQLMNHLAGMGKVKHRAAVVEVQSSGGTLDASAKVDVKTERFGDARSSDSMFQSYDDSCSVRVRGSFRLPELFFGKSGGSNFATAVVDYMVTEAQVFQPERDEFDEVINGTIMKELKIENYKFKSKPITLKNVDAMLKALELAVDKIEGENFVQGLNDVSGLNMEYSKEAEEKANALAAAQAEAATAKAKATVPGEGGGDPKDPAKRPDAGTGNSTSGTKVKKMSPSAIVDLMEGWLVATRIVKGDMDQKDRDGVIKTVQSLQDDDKDLFYKMLTSKSINNRLMDPDGVIEMVAGCVECISKEHRVH